MPSQALVNSKANPIRQESLGLSMINASDVVNPNIINDNFVRVEDRLGFEYVVNAGKDSNGWWWEQFNTGLTLFGLYEHKIATIPFTTEWSGYVGSATLSLPGELPFQFTSIPYFNIALERYDIQNTSAEAWRFFRIQHDPVRSNSKTPPNFCVYWWPPNSGYNRKPTLNNVVVSCFGYAFVEEV